MRDEMRDTMTEYENKRKRKIEWKFYVSKPGKFESVSNKAKNLLRKIKFWTYSIRHEKSSCEF